MSFSLVEQRVVLSMLLRKYKVYLPESTIHKDSLQIEAGTLSKPKDLELIFKPL
jgi:hypothetical protein